MSKLANMPMFPTERDVTTPIGSSSFTEPGVTYRQWLAGMAMQGMLGIGGPHGHIDGQGDETDTAALSVKYADALIAELEKQP